MTLDFGRPWKSTDNARIDAVNGRFRAECSNAHRLPTLADAAEMREERRGYCNEVRPHGAIGHDVPISLLDPASGPPS